MLVRPRVRRLSLTQPSRFPAAVIEEWSNPALQRSKLTTQNAPAVNVERQAPATMGDQKKRSVVSTSFDNDRDTYMVQSDVSSNHVSVVMGWDHAVLLEKQNSDYVLRKVYVHGTVGSGHRVFDKLTSGPLVQLRTTTTPTISLPKQTCRDHSGDGSCPWARYATPTYKVDRIVTYGVSSCSFTVLFTLDLKWIAISHMSGTPPIPVGFIMETEVDDPGPMQLIASMLPQSLELTKFDTDNLFARRADCKRTLLSRGKKPTRTEGTLLFPQMGHSDIGIKFQADKVPVIEGNVGVGQDFDYWTLIPEAVSNRLKNYARNLGVFKIDYHQSMIYLNTRILHQSISSKFVRNGHPLSGAATVTVVTSTSAWTITDGLKSYSLVRDTEYQWKNLIRRQVGTRDISITNPNEEDDIALEVVALLLNGTYGFQWIHQAIYDDIEEIFGTRSRLKSWSMEGFEKDDLRSLWSANKIGTAFAYVIGYILENPISRDHPYYPISLKWMKKYRMNITIPLQEDPIGR